MSTRIGAVGTRVRDRWLVGAAWWGGLGLTLCAAALLVSGCGQSSSPSDHTAAVATSPPSTEAVPATNLGTPVAASSETPQLGARLRKLGSPESVAPDLAVAVPDTTVSPGEVVKFTVHGTEDVNQVVLSDGLNDPQAFALDTTTNVWRVQYRVPLRPRQERIGVSVTARNESSHWRRVWVFLHVQAVGPQIRSDEEPELGAEPMEEDQ